MSSSGGGISGWGDLSLPGWLTDLKDYADELIAFAKNPIRYLRARAIPPILGAILGFAFDMASLIARPFDAVLSSLDVVSTSISTATQTVSGSISAVLDIGSWVIITVTAPLGPLQPFAAVGLTLLLAYGLLIAGVRLTRALTDSIPVVNGVETFLFG